MKPYNNLQTVILRFIAAQISKGRSKEEILEETNNALFKNENGKDTDMRVLISIKESFNDSLFKAIHEKNFYLVAILSATIIEHIINEFYFEYLPFSNTELEDILKTLSVKQKFGWLLELSFQNRLNSKLTSRILDICKARNKVAHYKPKEAEIFSNEIKKLLNSSLNIIEELQNELLKIIIDSDDSYKIASAIVDQKYGDLPSLGELLERYLLK